ncbi:serine hydrolase domain-containing protein [Azospirillum sp. A26]|uniref:serine hydrolase domain-containing protein n=1 Tax=Azospirillum sp. A26 TaxID=3160607 RepID=UPI0036723C4A
MRTQGRDDTGGFSSRTGRLRRLMPGLALLLALAIPASDAAAAKPDRLQRLLDRFLADEELDGGILLVSGPDGRRVVVSGIADRKGGRPVTEDTRFYVASVGKMATAAAVLQQVEEGLLSLDQPVRELASDLPLDRIANANRARLVHLLDHSSGIPDYITDAYQEDEAAKPERLPRDGTLLAYAAGEKATGPVGGHYEYSNSNYVLLGHIAARRDGLPFAQVLRNRVLERAGMASTSVGADPRDRSLAHGYTGEGDVSRRSWAATTGDGPLVTTAGDLERFVFALFRDNRLLAAPTVRRMLTPSENEEGQGLGVALWKDRWGRGAGHDGRYDGFEADVRYYPGRRTALIFLTNGNQQSDDALLDAVAEEVFGP